MPIQGEGSSVKSEDLGTKTLVRRPLIEGARTKTPHDVFVRRLPTCAIAKVLSEDPEDEGAKAGGNRASAAEGLLGEGLFPKPWSKMSSGEGFGARPSPTCRASCNPLSLYI